MRNSDERITAQLTSISPLPEPLGPVVLRSWMGVSRGLARARLGLQIAFGGTLAILLAIVMRIVSLGGASGSETLLLYGGLLVILPAGLVVLAGEGLLCTGPPDCGVRGWAKATFILGLVGRLLALLAVVDLLVVLCQLNASIRGAGGPGEHLFFALWLIWQLALAAAGVTTFGEMILLALTVRATALSVGDPELARRAFAYARFFIPFTFLLTVLFVLSVTLLPMLTAMFQSSRDYWELAVGLLLAALVSLAILLGQFSRLLGDTYDAVVAVHIRLRNYHA